METNNLLKTAISQIATNPQNALQIFQQILAENSQQPDALHGIGVLLFNDKQFAKSAEFLQKAISALQNQQILTPNLCKILSAWLIELAQNEANLISQNPNLWHQTAFHLMQSKVFSQNILFENLFHENFDFLFENESGNFWQKYFDEKSNNFEAIKSWLNNAENLYETSQCLAEPLSCVILALFLNRHTPPHSKSENTSTTLYKRIFTDCAYTFLAYLAINSADKNKKEITKNYLNLVENLQNLQDLQNFSENDDFFKHFQAMYFRLQAAIAENIKHKKSFFEQAEIAEKHYKNLLTLAQISAEEKNFEKAEDFCKQAESRCQNNQQKSFVCSTRAVIFLQQNNLNQAKIYAENAIKLFDKNKNAWLILRNISCILNDSKLAVIVCENLLKLNPHDESSWTNFGERLRRNYQIQKSLQMTQIGMLYFPESANLWANLGTALHGDGRIEQAKLAYKKALELKPEFAEIANNLGAMAIAEKSWEEALKYFTIASNLKPTNVDMLKNKASALLELKAVPEQVKAVAEQIRKVNPRSENADAIYARLYEKMGDYYKSLEHYQKALALNPNSAGLYFAIGGALKELHQFQEAEKYYQKSLEINPDNYGAVSGLLFTSHYFEYKTPQELFELAKHYGDLVQNHTDFVYDKWNINFADFADFADFPRENQNFLPQNQKIKVGFTSGDLRNHPVGYFLESVMQYLQQSQKLELFAYTTQNKEDDLTARIKPAFDHWIPVYGKSSRAIAEQIHKDGIQILIDLSGHTGYNALPSFAYKPAPIQCSWLGWFATTGLKQMDYVISDEISTPSNEEQFFTETILRFPPSFCRFCFSVPDEKMSADFNELPAKNNKNFTFACFNNVSKINDNVIKLWAELLEKSQQKQKLLFKGKQFADKNIQKNFIKRFENAGLNNAKDFLIFEEASPRNEYLKAYNKVDLLLDPFPYTGGTTTAESLFMGVPVLTLKGNSMVSHQGEAILTTGGLPEFIAKDKNEYIEKALFWSDKKNYEKLNEIRLNLREKILQTPLFKAYLFAQQIENLILKIWQKYLQENKNK